MGWCRGYSFQKVLFRRSILKVRLPDGTVLDVPEGSTSADVAAKIGPGLARVSIAGRVGYNGNSFVVDLNYILPGDCDLQILTNKDEDEESLFVLRHSTAHIMAEAICKLFPDTKLVYGPPLEDGFYYDIDLPQSITTDDFSRIETEMTRIIKEDRPFFRYELSRNEAMAKLQNEGSRYKIENAERAEGDSLSFYVTGDEPGKYFEDLCRGPHVPSTGVVKAFMIRQVSRSHYRGDINDQPLQRIYGTAFFKKSSLKEYLEKLEEARKRDHRVIGKALDLFTTSDQVGTGLILWLPKGATIRTELQNYLTQEMVKLGYEIVYTPHIGNLDLYRCSGHFPYYEDSQYPAMFETDRGKAIQSALQFAQRIKTQSGPAQEKGRHALNALTAAISEAWGEIEGISSDTSMDSLIESLYAALSTEAGYLLRPMNCPHHIKVYASKPRSYRDLPVRLAEYGTVYRYEQSGEVSGMIRVRGFTQDDAHIFCTSDQVVDELLTTVKLTHSVLETLGLNDYRVRVGLRDPESNKYVGSDENWARSEAAVLQVAKESNVAFTVEKGEAAFYGPKIDFVVRDCLGRSWQLGTVQCDYNLPERFKLTYIGRDNAPHQPIMIHRAPFGAMERFVAILIEHFAGAFPLWLSPIQVGIVTVSEKSATYGREVFDLIKHAGLRTVIDLSDEKIGPKKHRLRTEKINYVLVVGEKEAADRMINVNDRDGKTIGNMTIDQFVSACRVEIESKGRRGVAAF